MKDEAKTIERLTNELALLRQEIIELKKLEARHKQTVEALHKSEEYFRAITQNSSDIIIIVDKKGTITYVNPSVERFLGYKPEELVGKSGFDFIQFVDIPRAIYDFGRAILTKDVVIPNAFGVKHKDGSVHILEGVGNNLLNNPAVSGFVMNVRDITSRKNAEEELSLYRKRLEDLVEERTSEVAKINSQLLIELTDRKQAEEALKDSEQMLKRVIQGSPIPAFVIGKDHRVIYWNRALEELSGIKTDEVAGTTKHWRAFYSNERPCMADLLVDQVLEVIPQWYFEKYIKSPLIEDAYEAIDFFPALGDTGKWLRFTAAVIKDSQGEIVGAIETLQDVTERKQSRDTLEKLVQERTADLSMKNVQLINEIKERKQAEAELKRRKREVEIKSRKLEELNTTLKTLLKHRDEDKEEMEGRVMSNVKALLIPYIEKLKKSRLDAKSMFHVSMLESNLLDIISPFSHKLSSMYVYLTSKEIQVANLVKEGRSTKEIADMMDVSSYTIELHRFNIRKKLGIKSRKVSLKSYLLSIS